LSGRGLCDELITRPEESYRLCCVVVCDLETSRMGAPYIYDISRLRVKNWDVGAWTGLIWLRIGTGGLSNKVSNIISGLMDNMKFLLRCILLLSYYCIFFRFYFF